MYSQPYLETCCRSALHRLVLCGASGRPATLKDDGCLRRLARKGFAHERADGRFEATGDGMRRHDVEILGIIAPPVSV